MVSLWTLDLALMRVLYAVGETGSVKGAADRLSVTPPAVSNTLARARRLLGDPLYVRSGQALVPTPLAERLRPRLTAIFGGFEALIAAELAAFDPASCTRSFTIAAADNISASTLPAMLLRLRRHMPLARFNIITLDHAIASDALANGGADVLIGIPPEAPQQHLAPLYREQLVVVWDGNAAPQPPDTLERYLARRHVAVTVNTRYRIDFVDAPLAALGQERLVAVSVPQFALAAATVKGSQLVATLPQRMAADHARMLGLAACPLPFALEPVEIRLAWHERTDRDAGCAALRAEIHASFAGGS